jgi:uncharacterized protein YndB with AHSA1/START domain
MAPMVSTIEIACTPEEVFAVATDPRRFAEWQHDVVNVRMLGEARFATTRRISGAERTMIQQITRNDPPRAWAAQGIEGPIRPNATITVEPVNGGTRSRVTFTLDFEGHGIGVPLLPLVRRQAHKGAPNSYRNLKDLLEHGQSRRRSSPRPASGPARPPSRSP